MSIYGMKNIPKSKWLTGISGDTEQVGLLSDCVDWETALLEYLGLLKPPPLTWGTNSTIKVLATADSPAHMLFAGFPDIFHPGQFINPADITDGKLREITADETLDITTNLWGAETASTWYAVYAIAGDADADFSLKAMPYLRVSSDVAGVVTTTVNYSFTADELIGSYIYVLSGSKKGYTSLIDDNTTNTITCHTSLGLSGSSGGDWFIILPATNFRWLGDVYNNSLSNLLEFKQDGQVFRWAANQTITASGVGVMTDSRVAPPLATMALIKGTGGNAEDYAGHPTLTNQQVLMSQWVTIYVPDVSYPPQLNATSTRTFTPGFQPVPIDTCSYYMTSAGTFYSGGYGYSAGYLGY